MHGTARCSMLRPHCVLLCRGPSRVAPGASARVTSRPRWCPATCVTAHAMLLCLPNVVQAVDVLVGGDPCPTRSRARAHRPSVHPDLAGWFLAVAGRLRPQWVVRENVPAPDAVDFALGLAALGYGVVAFALDARDFTAQSRRRDFIVGCPPAIRAGFAGAVSDACDGRGFAASSPEEEAPVAACLTAHPARMAAEDSYVYEPGRGLRLLDTGEAEALQGFPRDWTAGFSRSRRRRMVGNAVNVGCAQWIAERIGAYEQACNE
jgi:site-specific DNA-cytosine methylase